MDKVQFTLFLGRNFCCIDALVNGKDKLVPISPVGQRHFPQMAKEAGGKGKLWKWEPVANTRTTVAL